MDFNKLHNEFKTHFPDIGIHLRLPDEYEATVDGGVVKFRYGDIYNVDRDLEEAWGHSVSTSTSSSSEYESVAVRIGFLGNGSYAATASFSMPEFCDDNCDASMSLEVLYYEGPEGGNWQVNTREEILNGALNDRVSSEVASLLHAIKAKNGGSFFEASRYLIKECKKAAVSLDTSYGGR